MALEHHRTLPKCIRGLKTRAERYGDAVVSVGVDTWGVDYALLDKGGRILGLPYQYRDSRTEGMMEKVFERISKDQIYKATGIQFIFFNSLFQLYSEVVSKTRCWNKRRIYFLCRI